ncbi:hypothetical protein AQJ66_16500 [Streptomyces bungoensis]|uniref:Lipoprotein n=1 Tax=Streptomyces bungoensis TaxID=285568 RepID=A0A101T1L9_9ACTN|nr:hypothetical protein [Streptomyces bungoensis]KUN84127.1 hypothetical protein AQJ66_16500 [Streptomyces bungoensis]
MRPVGRVVRRVAVVALGPAVLCLAGCDPDPTDPENVAPITLANGTSHAVHVFWCAGDAGDACTEQESLGVVAARGTRRVRVSSYEVLLRVSASPGPDGYVCRDGAPGGRVTLSRSYASVGAAYDHCSH